MVLLGGDWMRENERINLKIFFNQRVCVEYEISQIHRNNFLLYCLKDACCNFYAWKVRFLSQNLILVEKRCRRMQDFKSIFFNFWDIWEKVNTLDTSPLGLALDSAFEGDKRVVYPRAREVKRSFLIKSGVARRKSFLGSTLTRQSVNDCVRPVN